MKRLLCLALVLIISILSFSFSPEIRAEEDNLQIDTTLLAKLKLCVAGINQYSAEYDFNGDGAVNTGDLAVLKLRLCGRGDMISQLKFTSNGFVIEEKCGVTYIDSVLIVNKTYSLPETFAPGGLAEECEKAFNEMKKAAKKDGISIWIDSGYRSFGTQKKLYDSYVKRDGAAVADTYSARAGHSEHQTGLSIDVNNASTAAFNKTYKKVGEWLEKNCYKYGFIIRYPKGKESVTGYIHEPWHIRYVGNEYAEKITQSGLCLEEYFGITSEYA